MLGFIEVLKRLKQPVRFGLAIKHQEPFVKQLEKLKGNHFKLMQTYRHLKIHRVEPKILMRLPEPSDGLSCMVPLYSEKQIEEFDNNLKRMYPNALLRKTVKNSCYIKGVLFNRIRVRKEYWSYEEVEKTTRLCAYACVDVAKELSVILMRRAPLKQREGK